MKKILFAAPFFLIITFFNFAIFPPIAVAQVSRPNVQLLTQNFGGGKNFKALRPRIFQKTGSTADPKIAQTRAGVENPAFTPSGVSSLEHRVFELINQKRIEFGLQPVIWSDDVARVARIHSQNMATGNFFSHQGTDGKRVNDRADSAGVKKWRSLGENIAYNRGYGSPLESAVQSWMNSAGHRYNI